MPENDEVGRIGEIYIEPVLSTIFLLWSVITYSYIFVKIKQGQQYLRQQHQQQTRSVRTSAKQGFYLPFLLILTSVLFMVIPALLRIFCFLIYGEQYLYIYRVIVFLNALSYFSDACLLLFMSPTVINFRRRRCRLFRARSQVHSAVTNNA